jgi:bacterioferritin (cytochrome b1)
MGASEAELIDDLNRLMAEEAEASMRYFQMRFRLRGRGRGTAEKFFDEAIKETLEHAELIAKQIQALGHVPSLQINLSVEGGPMMPEDALGEALDVEQAALEAYQEFLPRVAGHATLEPFIRQQIAIETEHVQDLQEVLRSFGNLKLVARPVV